ncbi:hypothetical protein [Pseudolysinimonas sp.]|uniref:hypothetical protein n=1 Tax=Pseudolysinimonas sp. TaxID=2680009 RepID=UPI003F7E900B
MAKGHPATFDLAKVLQNTMILVRAGAGYRLDEVDTSGTPCDATGAPIGRFSPRPTPPSSLQKSDVVSPKGSN